jgi:hypothetical protein
MSLSVNSSLPKGLSLLVASTNTSLSEGLPGEFAALLSGEMLGLNGLDKNIKLTPEELLGKFASLLPEERLECWRIDRRNFRESLLTKAGMRKIPNSRRKNCLASLPPYCREKGWRTGDRNRRNFRKTPQREQA